MCILNHTSPQARPDAGWGFTHCLPWEYAALCAGLWRAAAAAAAPAGACSPQSAGAAGAGAAWRPCACFPANQHGRPLMGPGLWASLAAGPAELRAAHAAARVPAAAAGRARLARWALSSSLGDGKTLDAGDGAVGGPLRQRAVLM